MVTAENEEIHVIRREVEAGEVSPPAEMRNQPIAQAKLAWPTYLLTIGNRIKAHIKNLNFWLYPQDIVSTKNPFHSRKWLHSLLPVRRWLGRHDNVDRCYFFGLLFITVYLALLPLWLVIEIPSIWPILFILIFSSMLLTLGFLIEMKSVAIVFWNTKVGGYFKKILVVLALGVSFVLARNKLNEITGIDPSNFPYATTAISILLAPLAWSFLFAILLLLFQFVYWIFLSVMWVIMWAFSFLPILELRNSTLYRFLLRKKKYPVVALSRSHRLRLVLRVFAFTLGRIIGPVPLILGLAFILSYENSPVLKEGCKVLLVYSEFVSSSDCQNHKENERVSFINDDKIVVAKPTPKGIAFEVKKCEERP